MAPDPAVIKPWNRPLSMRLSVRGLVVLILGIGGWLGWVVHRARVQHEAVAIVERCGGHVDYDGRTVDGNYLVDDRAPWPKWLVDSVGIDLLASATRVDAGQASKPRFGDEEMAAVGRLDRIEVLTLGSDADLTDAGLAHVRGNPRLKRLAILNPGRLTGAGLASLADLAQLVELRYPRARMTDADLAHLSGLTRLRKLQLIFGDGSTVGDRGLAALSTLRELRSLELCETARVTNEGLARLGELSHLEYLNLTGATVTDLKGLAPLVGLKRLWLIDAGITDAGLASVTKLVGLESLILSGNLALTDAGLAHLSDLDGLQTLDLRRCQITDAGLASFQGCPRLQQLLLSSTQVGDEGLIAQARFRKDLLIDVIKTRVTTQGVRDANAISPRLAIRDR